MEYKRLKLPVVILFLLICMFHAAQVRAQQYDSDAALSLIEEYTKMTATNTRPIFWVHDWVVFIVALCSAAFAALSFYYSKKTAENVEDQTQKHEIKKEFQKDIFLDLIRHLYRNKICVCAIAWKLDNEALDDSGYYNRYPSEEHLLKLKVLTEDLRLDRFDNTPQFYYQLHQLEFFFRNYNIEVEVTLEHLKMKSMPAKDKKRDLVDTLEFKSQFLTKEILRVMKEMGQFEVKTKSRGKSKKRKMKSDVEIIEEIRALLIAESDRYAKNSQQLFEPDNVPDRKKTEPDRYRYYDDALHIAEQLNMAISSEYNKIKLIEFEN